MASLSPNGVISFPYLLRPQEEIAPNKPFRGYSCELLIPEGTDMSPLTDAIQAKIDETWGAKIPNDLKNWMPPESFEEGWSGSPGPAAGVKLRWIYNPVVGNCLSVRMKRDTKRGKPVLMDRAANILNDDDAEKLFYPGAICRFSYGCYAWRDRPGNGIGFGINAVQFVEHGESLTSDSAVGTFGLTAIPDDDDINKQHSDLAF